MAGNKNINLKVHESKLARLNHCSNCVDVKIATLVSFTPFFYQVSCNPCQIRCLNFTGQGIWHTAHIGVPVLCRTFHAMLILSREFEAGGMKPAGMDVGNKNKFDSVSEAVKTSSQIPQVCWHRLSFRCVDIC